MVADDIPVEIVKIDAHPTSAPEQMSLSTRAPVVLVIDVGI